MRLTKTDRHAITDWKEPHETRLRAMRLDVTIWTPGFLDFPATCDPDIEAASPICKRQRNPRTEIGPARESPVAPARSASRYHRFATFRFLEQQSHNERVGI
jgi:hypothetical protein